MSSALKLFFLSMPLFSAAGMDVYVSPDGDDSNPGTAALPVRTAIGARDRLRARRAAGEKPSSGAWRVEFADGVYVFDRPLELDARDSGVPGAPVVWRAANWGKVVFSGAVALDWKVEDDPSILARLPPQSRGRVMTAVLPGKDPVPSFQGGGEERVFEKSDDPVQLFSGGKRLDCARWPNGDEEAHTGLVGTNGVREARDGIFRSTSPRLAEWAKEPDLWAYGQWQYQFHQMTVPVLSVDPVKRMVKVGYREKAAFGIKRGMEYQVLNALCELDEPGEWTVCRKTRRLEWLPGGGSPAAAANARHIISGKDVSHVDFTGFTFEHARGDAMLLASVESVRIRASTFRHCGGWGVRVDGARRVRVEGCDLYDLGKGGVRIEGGDMKTLEEGSDIVVNCHIHHYGVIRPSYSPGIFIGGVGNMAERNLIHHSQHQGVIFRGNDHRVTRNIIHDVCTRNDDAGAIYCNGQLFKWLARGSVVEGNIIHFVGRKPVSQNCEGIYLDDWSSGVMVRGNVVCRANRAVHVGGGHLNTVTNNLFIATRPAVMVGSRGIGSFAENWVKGGKKSNFYKLFAERCADPKWLARYPDCQKILDVEDEVKVFDPIYDTIRGNALVGSGPVIKANNVRQWQGLLVMEDNPGFSAEDLPNLARFDFTPRPGSPLARKLGDLKLGETGLFASEWRASAPVRFGEGATPPAWPPLGAYDPSVVRVVVSFAGKMPEGMKSFADDCANAENPSGRRVSTMGYFDDPAAGDWRTYSFSFTPLFDCEASLDVLGSYGDKTLYDDFRVTGAKILDPGFETEGLDAWKIYDEKAKLGDFGPPYGLMTAADDRPAAEGRRYACANHEHWLVQRIMLKKGVRVTITFKARAEYANAQGALVLAERDSRLGYEPSMEYAAGPVQLRWKLARMRSVFHLAAEAN